MCNINKSAEIQLLAMGLNFISKLMESELRADNPVQSSDVLTAALTAYQQGKITKSQYIGVINALDEVPAVRTVQTTATSQPSWNEEYIQAHKFLNSIRRELNN